MRFGIDRAADNQTWLAGRVALLTAPSGRTGDNVSTVERLRELCDLRLLLGPEHGVRGDQAAGVPFSDGVDGPSGLPMVSLYAGKSKRMAAETLDRFDTLVYDVQDVGCRYYTFISSLRNVMMDCAARGKRLVVLDRPDPLGDAVEGLRLQPELTSFVGCCPMPARYGLTCGEFAAMVNAEQKLGCDLRIVPCEGLSRQMRFPDWGKIWVMPSMAMPRYETALLYIGACLVEGTNCSEGRGTADPFAIIGAPYVQAEPFAKLLNGLALPGVLATPIFFTPTASKWAGELCGGVHLHVTDAESLRPFALGVTLLALLRREYPGRFAFLPPVRTDGIPFISLLLGSRAMENADWRADEIIRQAEADSECFRERKRAYHLY